MPKKPRDFPDAGTKERDFLAKYVATDFLAQNPQFKGETDVENFLQRTYLQHSLEWRIEGRTYYPDGDDVRFFVNAVCEQIIERLPETEKPKPPKKFHSRKYGENLIIVGWRPLILDQNGKWKGALSITLLPKEGPEWHIHWVHYPEFFVRYQKFPAYLDRYYPGDLKELMAALKELGIGF
jgi:hypothetical protein